MTDPDFVIPSGFEKAADVLLAQIAEARRKARQGVIRDVRRAVLPKIKQLAFASRPPGLVGAAEVDALLRLVFSKLDAELGKLA